jgi:hypothetical protein
VVGQLLLSRSATLTFMDFSDPAVLATFWSLAFVVSEIIGMSKLRGKRHRTVVVETFPSALWQLRQKSH